MADANILLENSDLPGARQAGQLNTKLPVSLQGSAATLTVAGATTLGAVTVSSLTNTGTSSGSLSKINTYTTTAAPTVSQSGQTFLLAPASGAGFVTTLPAPTVGCHFTFIVTVSVTSSNLKIITDAGTTFLQGVVTSATTSASVFQGNGTSHISLLMNGTTTGGLLGAQFDFYCITATQWQVFGTNFTSGTTATPFSTS
jgi:hypothetical protein